MKMPTLPTPGLISQRLGQDTIYECSALIAVVLYFGITGYGWCSDYETTIIITNENNIKLTECGGGAEITLHASWTNNTICYGFN